MKQCMKQWMKPCLAFAVIIMTISGCSSKKTLVTLEEAGKMTEAQLKQELSGFSRDEIHAAWGEGTDPFSGRYGEEFPLDGEKTLLLLYEGDGQTVQDVLFGENSQTFEGTIKEINGISAVVEVDEGFPIRSSGDQVNITLDEAAASAQVGDRVRVTYSGAVMESYPLQLGNQKSVQVIDVIGKDESSEESERLTEPPVLQLQDVLSSTYEKFEVRSGDYNWHCKTGNKDEMTGAVACGPGPLDEAMEKERLKLPRYNKLDYVSYTVSWEVMPDRMVVKEYDITDLGNADAEPISSTEYAEIFTVDWKPDRVYEITAEWEKEKLAENGFYGNASYIAVTE